MKVVIVGAGEVGFHIASHLSHENKEVVVIDIDADNLRRVSDNLDVQVVQGSGSSPLVLEEAGLLNAEIILAVTDSDEANLVACLVANIISPTTKKLARVRDADFDKYHGHFREHAPHIDTIINPEIEVVKTITGMMSVPGAVDVGEFADGRIKFIGIYLDQNSRLAGVKLAELPDKINNDARPLIAAVVREEELIIPGGSDRLMPGDLVYFISEEETNILASLLATRIGAKKSITRISKFSYFPLMKAIGIYQVVSPRLSAINTILQHIRRGKVISAISIT